MRLLTVSNFELLFKGLENKVIGFLPLDGNVGDLMIQSAILQLFDHFSIRYHLISSSELDSGELLNPIDEIVVSGGGNMGTAWEVPYQQRMRALGFELPITIFPQSFVNQYELTNIYKKIFVRESASKKYCASATLAPDMALGMKFSKISAPPVTEMGLFLRKDQESCLEHHPSALVDPILISKTVDEYLSLASLFERIITDRLHFAIAGLMAGRDVTLLPNGYHKNRSMHETWLKDLGCHWLENAQSISYDRECVEHLLWKRLGGAPSQIIDWNGRPKFEKTNTPGFSLDIERYLSSCETYDQVNLDDSKILYSLCDGNKSIEEIVMLIRAAFPDRLVSIALDLQSAILSEENK